ncbi:hypothetical protein ACLVWU_05815 [Bdellovibrio sp. HCB290]
MKALIHWLLFAGPSIEDIAVLEKEFGEGFQNWSEDYGHSNSKDKICS